MDVQRHVIDLVKKNGQVRIPELGSIMLLGGITKPNVQKPPQRKYLFNNIGKFDDGILSSHIVAKEKVSKEEAELAIKNFVEKVLETLKSGTYLIPEMGVLENKNGKIRFQDISSSFGLDELKEKPALGSSSSVGKALKPSGTTVPPPPEKEKKKKWGIALIIILGILILLAGAAIYIVWVDRPNWDTPPATPVIETADTTNSKDTTTTQVTEDPSEEIKTPIEPVGYYVIIGAFVYPENAQKEINLSRKKYREMKIISTPNSHYHYVAVDGVFSTHEEAKAHAKSLKKKSAWVLKLEQ